MVVVNVLQNLELQPELLSTFAIETDDGPMRLVVEGLNLLAKPMGHPQVLQDIANCVVNVLHLSRILVFTSAKENPFSNIK